MPPLGRAGQSQAPLSCAAQGRPTSQVASARTLDRRNSPCALEADLDIHAKWPKPCKSRVVASTMLTRRSTVAGSVGRSRPTASTRGLASLCGIRREGCKAFRFSATERQANSQGFRGPPNARPYSDLPRVWLRRGTRIESGGSGQGSELPCTAQVVPRGRGANVPFEGEDRRFSSVGLLRRARRLRSNPSLERRPHEAGRPWPAAGSQAHCRLPAQGVLPPGSSQLER